MKNREIYLGNICVGQGHKPLVVAEMSGNHNQSLERALQIVDAAAAAGAHALKIQTYTADTLTLDVNREGFVIEDPDSLWKGRRLYDLYQEAHTPWDWHEPIRKRCIELGMEFFSTPFDESAVDFLEDMGVGFYKIGSFENTHLPLLRKVASTGKPLIVSTGMATRSELEDLVNVVRAEGNDDLILLKCTSTYPARPVDTNIQTIPHLRDLFDCQVGLSDHTRGIGVAVASVALGATLIEKHFTLDRSEGGPDAEFSLEPNELKSLVEESERAWQALGQIHYGPVSGEFKSKAQFKRSIIVSRDIKAGDVLTEKDIRILRPGLGLAPKHYDFVLGRPVLVDLTCGTPLQWEHLTKT